MLIYKDFVSGDELFSDTYPIEETHGGVILKVKAKQITESNAVDESKFGANASEEEAADAMEEGSTSGYNVALANRLVETSFSKAQYKTYIKGYVKKVLDKLKKDEKSDDEVKRFTKNIQEFIQEVLGSFKDYQFFMGETMNDEGQMVLVKWNDDESDVYFYFIKHGLEEEKV